MTKKEMLNKCASLQRGFKTIVVGVCICFILILWFFKEEQKLGAMNFVVFAVYQALLLAFIAWRVNLAWPKTIGIFCKKCGHGPALLKCKDFIESNACPKCGERLYAASAEDIDIIH